MKEMVARRREITLGGLVFKGKAISNLVVMLVFCVFIPVVSRTPN